ncbi:MAG: ElyC/SanA/YdcF family protein [Candidatus Saccharimonadales bacterium]
MVSAEKYLPELGPEAEKRQAIEALCQGKPDALYLLSGISEIIDSETGEKGYKPGSYADVDWNDLMTGGKARALAIVELAQYFPEAVVAVNSSTFKVKDPTAPTDAEVMAEYVARQGVPYERIILQDKSTTTFTELIELVKCMAKYDWRHVVVIAGETQKGRTQLMLEQIASLQDPAGAWEEPEFRTALERVGEPKLKVNVVSSEDILPIRDGRYAKLIAAARNTGIWQKREQRDREAVEDLKAGSYWSK